MISRLWVQILIRNLHVDFFLVQLTELKWFLKFKFTKKTWIIRLQIHWHLGIKAQLL